MTNTIHSAICTSRDHKDWFPHSPEDELETLDRRLGHDCLPMDVFVDPRTVKEHFQVSSIRARWIKTHPGAFLHTR